MFNNKFEDAVQEDGVSMTNHKLKSNESKIEFMLICSKQQLAKNGLWFYSDEEIKSKSSVRNLGCMFDSELQKQAQVQHILKSGYYHLR